MPEENYLPPLSQRHTLDAIWKRFNRAHMVIKISSSPTQSQLRGFWKAWWDVSEKMRREVGYVIRKPKELRGLTCGARNRKGSPCNRHDLHRSGRCRLHGGMSTGPKTENGKRWSARSGFCTKRLTRMP